MTGIAEKGKEIIAIDVWEFKVFYYSLQELGLLKIIEVDPVKLA